MLLSPGLALHGWALVAGSGSGKRVVIAFDPGVTASEAGERLHSLGLIQSPRLFAWYARIRGGSIEPGEHLLDDRLSAGEIFARLARLRTRPSVRVTVPEGQNHVQIAERLELAEVCSAAAFRRAVKNPQVLNGEGIHAESAEGYLFPATYDLTVDSDPAVVVHTLVRTFRGRFSRVIAKHSEAFSALEARGFGEREVVTLASIVERETALENEKKLVASVYMNRLEDATFQPPKMLQADPTAAYGCAIEPDAAPSCAHFDGRVTAAMLRDPQNRFNTYKHPGLPPTPIGNPGESALEAAIEPDKSDYLFFVAGSNGRHRFSRTLADHERAIEK